MFSRAGVGWVYEGFFGVDVPEEVEVGVVLVTHHHPRHVAGARRARMVVMNPIEYSMASDFERAFRYAQLVLKRAGAPHQVPKVEVGPFRGRVYKFTAGWVDLGDLSVRVVPCGSHTWGHTCFAVDNAIFVGDLHSWIVSVNAFLNVLSTLRGLRGHVVYTGEGERKTVEEYAAELEAGFKKLVKAYVECVGEKTPYSIALCARGEGDGLHLAEEGLAFVKYLAETGHVVLAGGSPVTVRRK